MTTELFELGDSCHGKRYLLPSGSEQYEVLLFGSIQEGKLQAHHELVQIEKNTNILV